LSRGPGVGARGARAAHGPLFGALLLDLDGCLIDSNDAHARAWSAALRRFGRPVDFRRIRPHIGKGGAELLRDFVPRAARHFLGDAMGAEQTRIFLARYARRVQPISGAARAVRAMRRAGIPVVIASSADRRVVDLALRRMRLRDVIDGYTTANDVAKTKPFEDIFAVAIARFRLARRAPVAVGDTPYDIAAAHQIGLPCIALLSGGSRPESLRSAEGRYRDLADLWRRGRELFV